MIKSLAFIVAAAALLSFGSFSTAASAADVIRIGATPVPHVDILNFIKPKLAAEGVDLQVIEVTFYGSMGSVTPSGLVRAQRMARRERGRCRRAPDAFERAAHFEALLCTAAALFVQHLRCGEAPFGAVENQRRPEERSAVRRFSIAPLPELFKRLPEQFGNVSLMFHILEFKNPPAASGIELEIAAPERGMLLHLRHHGGTNHVNFSLTVRSD